MEDLSNSRLYTLSFCSCMRERTSYKISAPTTDAVPSMLDAPILWNDLATSIIQGKCSLQSTEEESIPTTLLCAFCFNFEEESPFLRMP